MGDPSRSKATFDFLEIGMCLAAFVRLNLARIGDTVVRFSGVPIGGHLSKAVCSLILCHAETEWCNNRDFGASTVCTAWLILVRSYVLQAICG